MHPSSHLPHLYPSISITTPRYTPLHSTPLVYNANIWMMQYDNFKDRKLDSMFYNGFENFCESYRAVTWSTEYFQQLVREKNLGSEFWLEKMSQFHDMRDMLGVKLV